MLTVESLKFLPSKDGSDAEWIEFHKQMKKEVGKANANSLFVSAFEKRQGSGGLTGSKANTSALRDYMKSQGVDISANGGLAFVSNAIDDASGFIESAFKMSSTIFIILAVLVLIPAFVLMMNVAKNPQVVASAMKPI